MTIDTFKNMLCDYMHGDWAGGRTSQYIVTDLSRLWYNERKYTMGKLKGPHQP